MPVVDEQYLLVVKTPVTSGLFRFVSACAIVISILVAPFLR